MLPSHSVRSIDKTDYIILYAPSGQTGETSFLFASEPNVKLDGLTGVTSTFSNGQLVLSYTLNGSAFVPISYKRNNIVAILLDKPTANQWHAPIIAGPGPFGNFFSVGTNETYMKIPWKTLAFADLRSRVLVSGPYVLRSATMLKQTLSLVSYSFVESIKTGLISGTQVGDLNGTTAIEVVAPNSVSAVLWNNVPVHVTKTKRGSLTGQVGTPHTVSLPTLDTWKVSGRWDFNYLRMMNERLTSNLAFPRLILISTTQASRLRI
jgi:hypothetical protein